MQVRGLDHVVLTVQDVERTVRFYVEVLGLEPLTFDGGRRALRAGRQKINLQQVGAERVLRADRPVPGSADLCLVADAPAAEVVHRLALLGVPIEAGPVARVGARGAMTSVYLRDPDGNLVEVGSYAAGHPPLVRLDGAVAVSRVAPRC